MNEEIEEIITDLETHIGNLENDLNYNLHDVYDDIDYIKDNICKLKDISRN